MIGCERRARPTADSRVTPPSWRPDLTDKWTLAEEVARIDGYDRIPSVLPVAALGPRAHRRAAGPPPRRRTRSRPRATSRRRRSRSRPRSRTTCTARPRASTCRASSSRTRSTARRRSCAGRSCPACSTSRTATSSRGLTDLALFETGTVFLPGAGRGLRHDARAAARRAAGCRDPRRAGRVDPAAAPACRRAARRQRRAEAAGPAARPPGLADALDAVRTIALGRRRRPSTSPRASARRCTPAAPARCRCGGDRRSATSASCCPPWPRHPICPVAWSSPSSTSTCCSRSRASEVVAASLSGYPAATQDVSLVVGADVPAAEVRAALVEGAGDLLESLRLVDDYRGAGRARWREEPHVRAALPRRRPHAHRRRGDRGEARRRRRRGRAVRRDAARVALFGCTRRRRRHAAARPVLSACRRRSPRLCTRSAPERPRASADGGAGCRERRVLMGWVP